MENSMEISMRQDWLELKVELWLNYCGLARWC